MKTRRDRITRPSGCIAMGEAGEDVQGIVYTPHGIVKVYSDSVVPYTNLAMTRDGFIFNRSLERYYSPRYLVTLADRFAADVAEGRWKDR